MLCSLLSLTERSMWAKLLERLAERSGFDRSREDAVQNIIDTVRQNGDRALYTYTKQYDCPNFDKPLRVSEAEIHDAVEAVSASDLAIIREAAENIRVFHEAQKEKSWFITRPDGSVLGQKVEPVDRAGLYVPGGAGGETPLLSSLLMTAIPAQVAGVHELAVVSPPRADGSLNASLLATAHVVGVKEIYRVGSAWAIAALSEGTESIKAVDVIAGPGNIWVTTAKRLVQGRVGIDMLAGPSEVLILADETANPAWIAADMLAQAEHDPLSSALCITTDAALATAVQNALAEQVAVLPRQAIAEKALHDWSAVVVVPTMTDAVALSNAVAPEHLEVFTKNPWEILPQIRHAGAVFLGSHSVESLGDYMAGPSHVLPTVGTARFSSALSVETFTKRMSVISASQTFAQQCGAGVARLARLEHLEAHARSMEFRLK